ncbi:MAG: NAD(P)H-hydrate dehydratase [Balneolaceae bacterium]
MTISIQIPESDRLYTASQTRQLDHRTIHEFGIDGFTLMEIAASGAAQQILNYQGENRTGLFICGKGNNAGDALAAARYLMNDSNHSASILLLFGDDDLSDDTQKNLNLLIKCQQAGANVTFIDSIHESDFNKTDYIVDGLFGTGLKGDLRDPVPDLIQTVNQSGLPVYAMDIPTGLNADTGDIHGSAIKATSTFTFGTQKIGFYLNQADQYTGSIHLIPLPFPRHLYEQPSARLIRGDLTSPHSISRKGARHKYDGGVVHIIAGSEGLTGAAILAARSAWKQGAGAVFLYSPSKLMPVYDLNLPNIIKVPVGNPSDSYFREDHAETIIQSLQNKPGALLIGPGLGKNSETGKLLKKIVQSHDGFVVLDADGLSFYDQFKKVPDNRKKKWILTPHIGEAKSFLNGDFTENDFSRHQWAQSFAENQNVTLLLKGNPLFVAQPGLESYITGYKTTMFNRAGFGDVLSGAIISILSITSNPETALISALLDGYQTYTDLDSSEPFSPEHLL